MLAERIKVACGEVNLYQTRLLAENLDDNKEV